MSIIFGLRCKQLALMTLFLESGYNQITRLEPKKPPLNFLITPITTLKHSSGGGSAAYSCFLKKNKLYGNYYWPKHLSVVPTLEKECWMSTSTLCTNLPKHSLFIQKYYLALQRSPKEINICRPCFVLINHNQAGIRSSNHLVWHRP